jgi:hypothetical protein
MTMLAAAFAGPANQVLRAAPSATTTIELLLPGTIAGKASAIRVQWTYQVLPNSSGPILVAGCTVAIAVAEDESQKAHDLLLFSVACYFSPKNFSAP